MRQGGDGHFVLYRIYGDNRMIDKKLILERSARLDVVKTSLKAHFIGIDQVIDDLISYVRVWYVAPEVLRRPMIVNLWGMTGVGKTDLVRRLVSGLDMTNRFVEVELSNIDQSGWATNVSQVLDAFGFHDGKPAIVLFDEVQRFNTINSDGSPLEQSKYTDFWELLSDGRLSRRSRNSGLENWISNFRYRKVDNDIQRRRAADDDQRKQIDAQISAAIGFYEAQQIQPMLTHDVYTIEQVAEMTYTQAIELLERERARVDPFEPIDHSRTLIIISGNLDDAFKVAGQTAETDVDADVYHAFTQKISVVDIKNSLSKKFRPEQVARFGNTHIIYRSLRKQNFIDLITRDVTRVIAQTKELFSIDLTVDASINELIYRNGVFPVQGVRPVFSSVMDILEATLAPLIIDAIVQDVSTIKMRFDASANQMVAKVGKKETSWAYQGRVDRIRDETSPDAIANVSVHEAGHAVAHVLLLGIAPIQMRSRLANSYAAGFTFAHDVYRTRASLIGTIKILLAGGLAEELVFGAGHASIGRSADREQATMLLLDYIRRYGFDEEFQACYALEGVAYSISSEPTDIDAEKLMARLVAETKELLGKHQRFLMTLSTKLMDTGELDGAGVADVARTFKLICDVRPEGFQLIPNYGEMLTAETTRN
jgi:Peptidase family M41/ATPase family associated with various cellular activities (AAA)